MRSARARLQGLFSVYKPPGVAWKAVRDAVETQLLKDLNALERPQPRQHVRFLPTTMEGKDGKELTMTVTQTYTVCGLFGKATNDFSDGGKLIEKTTFAAKWHTASERGGMFVGDYGFVLYPYNTSKSHHQGAAGTPPLPLWFLPLRHYCPPQERQEPENSEPLSFLKGPASPRRWSVSQSMGSDQQQPLWRVVLLSLTLTAILLWCALRPETEVDRFLETIMEENTPDQEAKPPLSEQEKP
ncbi:hypothetical protein JD844_005006 [Phrynosoma platyrhinos]|uniref:Uncharacterized protein n=1 Tax=Phrynosoma platyrhinos TaxID=52577 RepID=A0ABQ7SE09_PHRPL|nr:hypothetical protein JD844_005006 [Phrynosoma platyrhinos]